MTRRGLFWGGGVALTLMLLLWRFDLEDGLRATSWLRDQGAAGLLGFALLYAVATALLLPASPLTLAAGALWDVVPAMAAVWVGAVGGAMGAFALGRTLLRGRVATWRDADARWARVEASVEQDGLRLIVLLRLSPLFPFNALNLGLGATSVRAWDYLVGTAVGIVPGTLLYVLAGRALGDLSAIAAGVRPDGGAAGSWWTWVGLAATLAVTWKIARVAREAVRLDTPPTQEAP